jgi:multimeric flavodoxin WrbA
MEQILLRDIIAGNRSFSLSVQKEDFSSLYPGFFRYTLSVSDSIRTRAVFRTNTYEYAPGVPLRAEDVALQKAGQWEADLREDPDMFLERHKTVPETKREASHVDVAIVQASPRADGNSSTLALWAEGAARDLGMTVEVIYPHDMDIHECIGCYQCFNTGTCIYDDDMAGIIDLISRSRLLIICTPVYTNTVPSNLKLLIDRFQAYYAGQTLGGSAPVNRKGLILSVAGRPGQVNFTCIKNVLVAFMHIAGITPSGEVFIDGVDRFHDIKEIPDCRERVETLVTQCVR